VDYAADGRIAGIEILDTHKRFGDPEVFRRVVLEDIALAKPTSAIQHDLPSQGVLLVSECVLNDDYSGSLFGVLMSLHLLVVCDPGARERSERDYRSFLAETGFLDVEVIRLEAPRDLIVARKH